MLEFIVFHKLLWSSKLIQQMRELEIKAVDAQSVQSGRARILSLKLRLLMPSV